METYTFVLNRLWDTCRIRNIEYLLEDWLTSYLKELDLIGKEDMVYIFDKIKDKYFEDNTWEGKGFFFVFDSNDEQKRVGELLLKGILQGETGIYLTEMEVNF